MLKPNVKPDNTNFKIKDYFKKIPTCNEEVPLTVEEVSLTAENLKLVCPPGDQGGVIYGNWDKKMRIKSESDAGMMRMKRKHEELEMNDDVSEEKEMFDDAKVQKVRKLLDGASFEVLDD